MKQKRSSVAATSGAGAEGEDALFDRWEKKKSRSGLLEAAWCGEAVLSDVIRERGRKGKRSLY